VHHGWHGTHRYDIQVLPTHASTWVHLYSSLLQWSVPLGQRGQVGGSFAYFVRNEPCTVTIDLLVWYSNTQNDFTPGVAIFSLRTLATPSGRNVNYDEKQHPAKKKYLICSFYLYRFCKYVSYGFPIINFCISGVHYKTPCICEIYWAAWPIVWGNQDLSKRYKTFGNRQSKNPEKMESSKMSLTL